MKRYPIEPIATVFAWLRRNLVAIIIGAMIVLQFLTWRAILDLRYYLPGSGGFGQAYGTEGSGTAPPPRSYLTDLFLRVRRRLMSLPVKSDGLAPQ